MTDMTQARTMANLMGALAQFLTGKAGRHPEFIDRVEVIIGGRPLDVVELLQLTDRVRATRAPLIWVDTAAEHGGLPEFALVADVGGRMHVIERCLPYMAPGDASATLVPDRFDMGAFRFGADLRLRHRGKPPKRSFGEAQDGIVRAYSRLAAIAARQIETGAVFELPSLGKIHEDA